MDSSVLDEEWKLLAARLPKDWRELSRSERAIRRERGITDPEALLRLILLHVATGLSLRQTVARAHALGWPSISDVGLLKRLRTSEPWLRALTSRMFAQSRFGKQGSAIRYPTRRLRAIDATTVEEPGATGTDWRVHYSILLPDMACDFYEVTDNKGGETYKRFPIARGDILLADRGYCHREGVAYVLQHHGDVVVRLNSSNFPLLDRKNRDFDLLSELRKLRKHRPREWLVRFDAYESRFDARLCAVRKSSIAAEQAKAKILREAKKKRKKVRPETLEAAEYIFVLTTLSVTEFPAAAVLELYRARWQIELVFKRLKSLLRLGHLPKQSDVSARAWIEAKLLTVLLIDRLLEDARFFSPWGFDIQISQPMARIHRRA